MNFHSLARRELQALCKKNKIPANMTNVAMADALQSLEFVDGIEEVLKTCESDVANSSMESPGKAEAVASVPRTGRRTTQRKTIKHEPETLQTSTRSHCRTRGTVVRDVDEAKNEMHETPALPTTRRRAATTSVRAKLESVMKDCEPKEKTGDQVEEEKKDVPKTPAAARASQRKEVKAKSSVRQVYSTRRSVRLAGKPMEESSTQEDETSGTLTFDAVSEETDESLEVNSELHSAHKTEELDKNGIDLKSSESLDIKNESYVSGQDSNTLVQNELDMEDGVQQEEGSEEGALGQNNNNGSEEVSGEEAIEESEIDAEANVVLTKQLHEQDEPHCGDTSDFVEENDEEGANFNQMFECQVDEGAECNSDVAGKQVLIGEMEAKVRASQQKCLTNMQANIDSLEVNLFEQFNGEEVSSQQKCLTNMDDAGEELMEENEVHHSAANVDSVAHGLEVAGAEEPMEEYDVDCTEANMDAPADALEVAGEEEPMEEFEVDYAEATVESAAGGLEVAGEEEHMEEYDVDCTEANVDAPAGALEVAGKEELMEEFEIDYAEEATVESAAHSFPPLPVIPDAVQEGECEVKVSGSQQCLHVSEANTEVAGEEPMEESEIDHVVEANVDSPAHALPPPASLMPNAAPAATSIGQILVSDNKENLVCTKENKGTAGNDNKQSLQNLSLRKLTKMLKDLKISKDPTGKEAANSRSALQNIPENRLTSENKN